MAIRFTHQRIHKKEAILRLMQAELPTKRSFYAEFARDIFLFSHFLASINFKNIAPLRHADMDKGRIYYRLPKRVSR